MRLSISYFNNIRHFNKYDIPLSTAMWDPKWYTQHLDKNGVVNGLRCEPLVFKNYYSLNTQCQRRCEEVPFYCEFMQKYYQQLMQINFIDLIEWFKAVIRTIAAYNNDILNIEKYNIVLIVHEKPEIPCAERPILQKWFKQNGVILEEKK